MAFAPSRLEIDTVDVLSQNSEIFSGVKGNSFAQRVRVNGLGTEGLVKTGASARPVEWRPDKGR